MRTLKWPLQERVSTSENKYENKSWTEECQGVANDGCNWYFTQDRRLWKFLPDKKIYQPIPGEMLRLGYNHMGDLDYYNGKLYVPLEGTSPPRILLYRTEGTPAPVYLSNAELTHFTTEGRIEPNTYSPWCAINPLNGLLYTSEFNTRILYVYSIHITSSEKLILEPLGSFHLFDEVGKDLDMSRVQGGVFSHNTGHLYLVSDNKDTNEGGIMGFDMITGRRAFHKVVDYDPKAWPEGEELEGIDIWNTPDGQIHLIMLQNENAPGAGGTDDVYFKHYKVEIGAEDFV